MMRKALSPLASNDLLGVVAETTQREFPSLVEPETVNARSVATKPVDCQRQLPTPNGGVDAAARFHSGIAVRVAMRNTLPPLASNDLFAVVASCRESREQDSH